MQPVQKSSSPFNTLAAFSSLLATATAATTLLHPAGRRAAAAASQFHSITPTQPIGLFCGEKSNFLSQSV